ncbi:patatin family protein [Propionigenium maris DSM 9537]|uniref:Patatin family protein n=1 Tax=Propionigenium maris DSM 9537 TaxID=1123000 RepID=A0A9W6GIP3_9FUSO|nr:patatin family protein [Propionigenium maris]GLI54675.1 patatin family protein [Propionigenium maris DSM 9537]
MERYGLVLEGGGTRGVYTAGVLDAFLEYSIEVPYVIGVSIGAYNGAAYVAKQKQRNYKVYRSYANDPRFIDYKRIFRGKSIMDSKFIFDHVNSEKYPFDYKKFFKSSQSFVSVSTDCNTGGPAYFEKSKYTLKDVDNIIRSSCSLPFMTDIVEYKNKKYLDGGIADSIPIRKAILDGNQKLIVILTHPKGFEEKQGWYSKVSSVWYKEYPKLTESLKNRYLHYNESLQLLEVLEMTGKAYIIRPKHKEMSMIEQDVEELDKYYDLGWKQGIEEAERIKSFMQDMAV